MSNDLSSDRLFMSMKIGQRVNHQSMETADENPIQLFRRFGNENIITSLIKSLSVDDVKDICKSKRFVWHLKTQRSSMQSAFKMLTDGKSKVLYKTGIPHMRTMKYAMRGLNFLYTVS